MYDPPEHLKERFDYLVRKIKFALDNDHKEMYNGYSVLLREEFKNYTIKCPK